MAQFTLGMLFGIIPTIGFLVAAWLALRAGLKLGPTLMIGYGVWGIWLAAIIGVKRMLGL